MFKQKEITDLLTNIKKAVTKNVSLPTIAAAIKQTYRSSNEDKKIINEIIALSCKEYSITKHDLLYSKSTKGLAPTARKMCMVLMINVSDMSYRRASASLQRGPTLAQNSIEYFRSLDADKFEDDRIFLEKYNKIKSIINNH